MTTERLEGAEVVCDCDECHGSGDSWYVKGVDEPCRSCKGSGEGIATKRVAPNSLTAALLRLGKAAEELDRIEAQLHCSTRPGSINHIAAKLYVKEAAAVVRSFGSAALRTARGEG